MSDASRSVYVLRSESGPVKIGIAADPTRRCRAIQTTSPVGVTLEYVLPCEVAIARPIERRSHAILGSCRMQGEWFAASVADAISAITRAAAEIKPDELVPHLAERPFDWNAIREMARSLGATETNIQKWEHRRSIPHKWRFLILCKSDGRLPLNTFDCLDAVRHA